MGRLVDVRTGLRVMAEPYTVIDLEFHFTSGEQLYVSVHEGRDHIDERMPGVYRVTVTQDEIERTLTVHTDKLNAVQRTTRLVQPEPPTLDELLKRGRSAKETTLEL